jgi:gliding motility-associated-like protein
VAIVVRDSSADSNIASRTIKITNEFPELGIVNAFTPNSDRVNDYWDFKNLQFYKQIKIAVFNEDGVRVFDCGDKGCKWDGKNRGNELPAGPYFYSISLNDGKRTYRGTVTILK